MSSKTSFASSMSSRKAVRQGASTAADSPPEAHRTKSSPKSSVAPSRADKAPLVAYIDKPAMKLVKVFCAEEEIDQQALVITAVNEYLTARGRAGIL